MIDLNSMRAIVGVKVSGKQRAVFQHETNELTVLLSHPEGAQMQS
jgi:hypothetical protein